MAFYRIKLDLAKYNYGVSETYITPDVPTPSTLAVALQNMVNARMAMLTSKWEVIGVRASLIGQRRASEYFLPGANYPFLSERQMTIPAGGTYTLAANEHEDNETSVVLFKLTYNTQYIATKYLVGAPQPVLTGHPASFNPAFSTKWNGAYNAFRLGLSNSTGGFSGGAWNVLARVEPPPAPALPAVDPWQIVNWSYKTPTTGIVGATITAGSDPGIVAGRKVHVYASRSRTPLQAYGARLPNANGTWIVDSVVSPATFPGNVTVFLRGTSGINPDSFKVLGRLFPVTYQIYPIQGAIGTQAGERKRGRPLANHRGRRLTRLSLDP